MYYSTIILLNIYLQELPEKGEAARVRWKFKARFTQQRFQ